MERCSICRRYITDNEQAYLHGEKVVCWEHWKKINAGTVCSSLSFSNGKTSIIDPLHDPMPTPDQIKNARSFTAKALNAWESLTEKDIGDGEMALLQSDPFGDDKKLLYALRVSKGVPRLVKMQALANSWKYAILGATCDCKNGGYASIENQETIEANACISFLVKFYAWKFQTILVDRLQKSDLDAAGKKTLEARCVVWRKAIEEIQGWPGLFNPPFPVADEMVSAIKESLIGRILSVEEKDRLEKERDAKKKQKKKK